MSGEVAARERPNILFVLTEDQGAHMSVLGTPGLKTPHMDLLAKSGTCFTNAFVAYPVCSASKAAIYTGLHNHANGILNNTHNFHKSAADVTEAERSLPLARNNRVHRELLTLPEILQANDYYQGVTHKLHVLPNAKFPYDEFLHGSEAELEGFIDRAKQKKRPWFLLVNIPDSHRPYPDSDKTPFRVRPEQVDLPPYLPDSSEVRKDWAEYLAGIELADAVVGGALDVVSRSGENENTIVVFMSDHGPTFQHGKMTLYDLGLRVPLIVCGPGVTPGVMCDQLVSELDLLPSILELCGIEQEFDYPLHGKSIHGLVTGDRTASGHDYVFAEISNRGPLPNEGIQERCVFDGRWKLIYRENVDKAWRQVNADSRRFKVWGNRTYAETVRLKLEFPEAYRILSEMDPQTLGGNVPSVEVYDLNNDPDEMCNLAEHPAAAGHRKRLMKALVAWAQDTQDTSLSLVKDPATKPKIKRNVAGQSFVKLKQEMSRKWPNNRLIRFVFHGHSVPAGYFRGGNVRRFDSYPVLFHQALCYQYSTAVIDVCTTAIGGEHSEKGAGRFAKDVLSMQPDVVFIDYCLNDRVIGVDAAERHWRDMIQAAQSANVSVVLLTPTPDSHEQIRDPTSKLAKHAASVRKMAAEFGVPVVDSYQAFQTIVDEGGEVSDFLSQPNHPNRRGHQVVAKLIMELFQ